MYLVGDTLKLRSVAIGFQYGHLGNTHTLLLPPLVLARHTFSCKKTLLTPESIFTATGHIIETQTEESSHQTAFLWFLQSKDKTDTADAPFQSRE